MRKNIITSVGICFIFLFLIINLQAEDLLVGDKRKELTESSNDFIKKIPSSLMLVQNKGHIKVLSSKKEYADLQVNDLLDLMQKDWYSSDYLATEALIVDRERDQKEDRSLLVKLRLERFTKKLDSKIGIQTRELVSLTAPEKLAPSYYLSIRPKNLDLEEFFWHSSKLGKTSLKLSSVLRDENLPGTFISLNDFFGFSQRVIKLELQSEDQLSGYLPYLVEAELLTNATEASKKENQFGGCFRHQNRDLDANSPILANLAFRELVKITLLSTDAFSTVAKRIIFLDEKTLLPVYQEIYDRSDRLIKSVLSIFELFTFEGNKKLFPLATIIFSEDQKKESILYYKEFLLCSESQALTPFNDLDPSYLTSFK